MADLAELHRRALNETRAVVSRIRDDQLGLPTPDSEWDVRALLNHVVSGNLWAAELAAGATIDGVGGRLDGDVLGPDPLDAYDRSAKAAAAAFEAAGAMDAPCAVSYGPVPGSVYAGHRFLDVLVHGWDLADATGQDARLEPALVAACAEVIEPQLGLLQGSGMFGEALPVSADADEQTKLLALLGRRG